MQLAALSHNYIFLTFLALSLFTAFNILSNVFTQKSKDQQAFAIIFNGIASTFALMLFLINQPGELFRLNMTSGVLLLIPVATVILYTFTGLIRFVPVKHLPPSTLQFVGTVSTVVSLIMSYFLYRDVHVAPLKILGILLIIAVNLYLARIVRHNTNLRQRHPKKHLMYLLLGIALYVLYGIAGSLDKMSSKIIGVEAYNMLVWILPTIFMFIFAFPSVKSIPTEVKRVGIFKIAFLSALNVVMYFVFLKALQYGPAFNVLAMLGLVNVTTFLAESVFLKDRVANKFLQGILAVLSTVGVVLIVR